VPGRRDALSQAGGHLHPSSYTSTIAPLSSSRLWNEVRGMRDIKHFETHYVVKIHNAFQMSPAQPCFTFDHPGDGWARGWSAEIEPPDNSRVGAFSFECSTGGRLHGFVGYFHATLYKDVAISTDPATESVGMFSWFPLYMPLRHPVTVPDGATVAVQFWRHVSSHKVWYEWALTQPQESPLHNPNGRSYYIGL
jgi:protein arginine N-methyltransferase 5